GTHDTFCEVEASNVLHHRPDLMYHEFSVFGVDKCRVFGDGRRVAARIEAMNGKQLWGPVLETGCLERPTTHLGRSLPFGAVELVSFVFFKAGTGADPALHRIIQFGYRQP